jgi:hypothetical protein
MTAVCNRVSFTARCNMPSTNIGARWLQFVAFGKQVYVNNSVMSKFGDSRTVSRLSSRCWIWPSRCNTCNFSVTKQGNYLFHPKPAAAFPSCKFHTKIDLIIPHWFLDFLSRMKVLVSWIWVVAFCRPEEPIRKKYRKILKEMSISVILLWKQKSTWQQFFGT